MQWLTSETNLPITNHDRGVADVTPGTFAHGGADHMPIPHMPWRIWRQIEELGLNKE